MRRNAVLMVAAACLLGVPGAASAQRPSPIGPHQHFLVQPDRELPVGPDVCTNPAAAQGFYGFHQNIHTGTPNLSAFAQPNNPIGFDFVRGCTPP
jgi:hypothetical protein